MRHLVFCMLLAQLAALPATAGERRELVQHFPLGPGRALHLDLPSGDLKIQAGQSNVVEVELLLECRFERLTCQDTLADVRLLTHESPRRLSIRTEGIPLWRRPELEIKGTVLVPAAVALSVEMGAGALEIAGITGDLDVDVGAGDVTLRLPHAAVRSVALDATIGEVEIFSPDGHLTGRRSLLVGSEAYWGDGPGRSRVTVDLGAGEITLFLE